MIVELLAINGCILVVYYCPDEVFRLSVIDANGRVLIFDDIFFCSYMALHRARYIVRVLTS